MAALGCFILGALFGAAVASCFFAFRDRKCALGKSPEEVDLTLEPSIFVSRTGSHFHLQAHCFTIHGKPTSQLRLCLHCMNARKTPGNAADVRLRTPTAKQG